MTSRRPIAIALATSAFYAGIFVTSAHAEMHYVRVTLVTGQQITITVDIPPGTPVDQLQIPGLPAPIASIVDLGSTDSTPTPTATPIVTPTATPTPTPGPSATPAPNTGSGGKKDSDYQTGKGGKKPSDTKQGSTGKAGDEDEGTVEEEDANKASGGANTESLAGKVATPTPSPTPVPDSQVDPPSQDDPTFSLAEPGPAKAGVPNFFIDKFKIPPFLLPIYQAAGTEYGIRWEVLAAINEIETNYGRLNEVTSSAGAQGWMQFMPATWKAYGVDGNKDGLADPYNPVDAIFSAARYLKAAGADKDLRAAVWAYNHADWYVDSVLLRAQVIGGMPESLVSSLTGLTEGRFPVAAKATYADEVDPKNLKKKTGKKAVVEGNANRTGLSIYADAGAPVIAVSDVQVTKIGVSDRLGRFVQVQDAYGNTYTYGRLAKISQKYAAPKPQKADPNEVKRMLAEAPKDKKPKTAASSTDRPAPKTKTVKPDAANAAEQVAPAAVAPVKQRLFANPTRVNASVAGGAQQEFLRTGRVDGALTPAQALGLGRDQIVIKNLKVGSQVPAGTVLGRIGTASSKKHPHMRFEVRPAGRGAPRIDPKPILDGWKLLESTAIYRAQGENPFVANPSSAASVGQILLMDKDTLIQRVLNNPKIQIYGCGRQDIQAGAIDRRVLATLEFLVANGFNPTISSLQCGHSYMTASGNVSEHSIGSAMDIAAINGTRIEPGTQGKGSITEQVIQSLLTLQGNMKPHQIISLMKFEGADNTLAMGDHDDHIHVGFAAQHGENAAASKELSAVLKPDQWGRLIQRLGEIDNPIVPLNPSSSALKVDPTGTD
ncbi:transglycosylase protein with SLT domain [Solirubrobacter pauli]|uniref:Transglycosylase protein with SLT domain n=1 Tax=Solirubrobacter pauli TaxID=166793 RepID=A0A660LKH1_9ACTN|nr:lytic murein transglycosylase [Solirubrobacter pauli]RKQ93751.1 transglycosylase protein with SLT domain [Solirubrobacter pauli]